MTKDATIYGMSLFNAPGEAFEEIKSAIYDGLGSGALNPVVRESIPLAEAPRAQYQVIESKAFGKIVLTP
jgi:NADPH:quinone reductase-like Zn-dependent oxidoreductase